ncbi:Biotin carboxyl carrier protein of acetyl-CoA carboxylase [Clostridiaceae bacterium JG1575]|nr:Biotin carboxyl carrier protein of acetyl-CoA carboxylase [Clostridiaceae bacterium JG1575]
MEDKLRLLAKVLKEYGLTGISLEEAEVKIHLEKTPPAKAPGAFFSLPQSIEKVPEEAHAEQATQEASEQILAPLAGIYYSRPAPNARPFVREGASVKAGDILCIIESMKIMNEIKAPRDLTVIKIRKRDEEVAQYNEPLFEVTP